MSEDQNMTESSMPASTSNNNMMLIGGIVAVAAIAVVAIGGVFLLGGSGGSDEGTSIPGDFEKYEKDGISFGYPENWEVSEEGDMKFTVSKTTEDEDDFAALFSGATVNFEGKDLDSEDQDEDEKKITEKVKDGKCSEIKDLFEESFASQGLGDADFNVTIEDAKLNGLKGCSIDFTAEISESGFSLKMLGFMYMLVDGDTGYSAGVIMFGDEKSDDYEDALKIVKTFKVD